MQKNKSDIRSQISTLIQQALDLGTRGDLRDALVHALELADGTAARGLSDLHYRRLKTPGRLTDPVRAGFIMIASQRGKRWMYRSQGDGTQRQVTLGRYPDMTLEQARAAWARVSSEGMAVADKRGAVKLSALVSEYLTAIDGNRTVERTRKVFQKHLLQNHADLKVGDLTAELLESCYEHLIDTQPGTARNILTPLSAMMRWAETKRRLPTGMTAPRLAAVPKGKIKEYFPDTADLRTALKAIRTMGVVGDVIQFQLLTGVRISEAREADWSEIRENVWLIPGARMKNGQPHTVLLSDAALAVLERQPGSDGPIFRDVAHTTLMRQWRSVRAAVGLPADYGTHCHRKALLTWVAEQGGGLDIRNRLSAHHDSSSVDAHYMRSSLNESAADWWQRWGQHVTALGSDNVVRLGA